MAAIHAIADFEEAHCPACGAAINAGPKSRKRKVQCPKCREIVELGKTEPVPVVLPDATSARISDLEARVIRLEALEARVSALESSTRPVDIVPFPEPEQEPSLSPQLPLPLPPEPVRAPTPAQSGRKLRWMAPSERHRAPDISSELQDALQHNLSTFTANALTLRAAADNPIDWQRAEQFKAVFERANWKVSGPHHAIVRRGDHGLSLAVGSVPPPPEAGAIYLALTASGFGVDSVLDPSLRGSEAALIVG